MSTCEICGSSAKFGMNDHVDPTHIRYSCYSHQRELWQKMEDEKKKENT